MHTDNGLGWLQPLSKADLHDDAVAEAAQGSFVDDLPPRYYWSMNSIEWRLHCCISGSVYPCCIPGYPLLMLFSAWVLPINTLSIINDDLVNPPPLTTHLPHHIKLDVQGPCQTYSG